MDFTSGSSCEQPGKVACYGKKIARWGQSAGESPGLGRKAPGWLLFQGCHPTRWPWWHFMLPFILTFVSLRRSRHVRHHCSNANIPAELGPSYVPFLRSPWLVVINVMGIRGPRRLSVHWSCCSALRGKEVGGAQAGKCSQWVGIHLITRFTLFTH